MKIQIDKRYVELMAVILVFWSPHLFLEYKYSFEVTAPQIKGRQYYFFFFTLLGASFFWKCIPTYFLKDLWQSKRLKMFFVFLLIGVAVSIGEFWNVRLFLIWLSVTTAPILAAVYLVRRPYAVQTIVFFLVLLPCWFPILVGMCVEIIGLINSEIIQLDKGNDGRWRYLHSSANGIGFDAALITLAGSALLGVNGRLKKLFATFVMITGLLGVFFAETRAAFLMVFAGWAVVFVLFATNKARSVLVLIGSFLSLSLFFLLDWNDVFSYLRIQDSFELTSSGRSAAVFHALSFIQASPVFGLGFGAADNNPPFQPTNLFYFMIPVEVGLFGALGIFGILLAPLTPLLGTKAQRQGGLNPNFTNQLVQLSVVCYVGILFFLVAEFTILRVSATNQLFFFFWTVIFLSLRNTSLCERKDHT